MEGRTKRLMFIGSDSHICDMLIKHGNVYDVKYLGPCGGGVMMAIREPGAPRGVTCPYSSTAAFEANWAMPDNEIDG